MGTGGELFQPAPEANKAPSRSGACLSGVTAADPLHFKIAGVDLYPCVPGCCWELLAGCCWHH